MDIGTPGQRDPRSLRVEPANATRARDAHGFARTFYLRPWLAGNAIDGPLVLHGTLLTAWFTLAFLQAWLVTTRRVRAHRRLAWLAAAVVPAVVVSSAWINTRLAARIQSARDPESMFVWGKYLSLVAFAGLVVAAIAMRRRPDAHRRLLLMASIAIVAPAFARFAFWPGIDLGLAAAPCSGSAACCWCCVSRSSTTDVRSGASTARRVPAWPRSSASWRSPWRSRSRGSPSG